MPAVVGSTGGAACTGVRIGVLGRSPELAPAGSPESDSVLIRKLRLRLRCRVYGTVANVHGQE